MKNPISKEVGRAAVAGAAGAVVGTFNSAQKVEKSVRSRNLEWIDVGILWGIYLVAISITPIRSTYFTINQNWDRVQQSQLAQFVGLSSSSSTPEIDLGREKKMKVGESIAGYPVTSARGKRNIGDGNEMHEGVDLATEIGSKLHAPTNVIVTCSQDSNGGGLYATLDMNNLSHRFLHLSDCTPGSYKAGDVFARTGNSGRSTGPHLDYRMKALDGRNLWKEPSRAVLTSVMSGNPLNAAGGDFTQKYKLAISKQESAQDYTAVNPHSGALGKYQFMPETAKAMQKECDIDWSTQQEFLSSQPIQESTMDCYVNNSGINEENENLKCRKLASFHYSGDPDLFDNKTPETYGIGNYPSISDYTQSVCKGF